MYLLDQIESKTNDLNATAQALQDARVWIEENQTKLESLSNAILFVDYANRVYVDFERLAHDQIMLVVSTLGCGRWNRSPNDGRIDYTCQVKENVLVRCYQGQPPPNCKIIYEEVQIPAQPARIERRPKIVCQPVTEALPTTQPAITE